jgi:hypothetical protein
MNGDGGPDLVVAQGTTWNVYLNTGSGFEAEPLIYAAPLPSLQESICKACMRRSYSTPPAAAAAVARRAMRVHDSDRASPSSLRRPPVIRREGEPPGEP